MTFLLGLLLTLTSATAGQNAMLKSIEPQSTADGFVATMNFDKDFSPQIMIDYQNEYVQIDMKGQAGVERREVIRVADKEVQSVVVSQFAPDVVRARLVFRETGDPARFKGRIKAESEGSTVRFRITPVGAASPAALETVTAVEPAAMITDAQELLAAELQTRPPAPENPGFVETAQEPAVAATSESAALTGMTDSTPKSEADIPVLDKLTKKTERTADPMNRLFISLAIIAVVALGILAFGRFYAKRKSGLSQHHQIKVLTQYGLGPKKSLAIIRVAGESILIGITDHNISMIKSLAMLDEDLPMEVPTHFNSSLDQAAADADKEDFSFGGVKDMVASRLREMRSL